MNSTKGNGFEPRVVGDVAKEYSSVIKEFIDRLTKKIDNKDPDSLLRSSQNLVTSSRAAILEFERQMGEQYYRAIARKFRSDVVRLWEFNFLLGYATNQMAALAQLEPLEKAIIAYFQRTHYSVGRSQRFSVPVFPEGYVHSQVVCLREVLQRYGVSAVGSQDHFNMDVSEEFTSQYDERVVINRKPVPMRTYALIGVHGGKDTPQYSAKDSLEYFEEHRRLPLTFKEALALFTAHPRFLREQECVLLLGERYPSGKYAYIASPQKEKCLRIGLISLEVADEVYRPPALAPFNFHAKDSLPRYGKPSAAALVVDSH